MSAIFISYRREDAEGHAGRLFQALAEHFGSDSVFMDVAGIEPGRDFRKAIDANVASCGALLAVIGRGWLAAVDEAGQRRIDAADDFVRLETVSALRRDIPVIPVLVHGAAMPRAEQLPPDMQELAFRNGVELTHARWDSDVRILIKALERHVGARAAPGAPVAGAATRTEAARPPAEAPAPAPAAAPSGRGSAMKWGAIAVAAAALAWGGIAIFQGQAEEEEARAAVAAKAAADQQAAAREAELRAREDNLKKAAESAAAAAAEAEAQKRAAAEKAAAEVAAAEKAAAEKAIADKAAAEAAARDAELRAREASIRRQAAALEAARLADEQKRAEAARLARGVDPARGTPAGGPAPAGQAPGQKQASSATAITFVNAGERELDVYWLDFEGKERPYLKLAPGKGQSQPTYTGHNWVVRDAQTQRQVATAVGAAQPTTVRLGEERRAEAAPAKQKLLGRYENHHYDAGGKNDWQYVTVVDAGGDQLRWSTRAGPSWGLTMTANPGELLVGQDCPYFARGHKVVTVEWKGDGTVARLRGPGGEWYDRASR